MPAAERAEIVAALAPVDYVVTFADENVERLLAADQARRALQRHRLHRRHRSRASRRARRTAAARRSSATAKRTPRAISSSRSATNDQRPTTNDQVVPLPPRPSRRARRHRPRDSRRGGARAGVSGGAHRLAGQRQAPRVCWIWCRSSIAAWRSTIAASAGGDTRSARRFASCAEPRYDVVFDLQGLLKSAVLARLSGAPRVVGFSSTYLRERLARPFYTDVHDPGGGGMYDPRERSHVVQMNLGLLNADRHHRTARRNFRSSASIRRLARAMREQAGGRYVLVNPGAAWPNKRWPAERFGAAGADPARARHGLRTIVSWGPGEEALAQEVVREAGGAALLSPKTSIADLVALIRGAALMMSGDTGPTHIAAALGTPHRRHLRADAPVAQRTVGRRRHHRLARRDLPVPPSARAARSRGCACSTSRRPRSPPPSSGVSPPYDRAHASARLRVDARVRRSASLVLWLARADGLQRWRPEPRSRWSERACESGRRVISTRRARSPCPVRIGGSRIRSTSGRRSWASVWPSIANHVVVSALIAVYLVATLTAAIKSEEAFLRGKFGDRYDRYRRGRRRI